MSIAAVSVCLDAHVDDASTWRVLVTLADYTDPLGRHAFPAVSTLVDRTGYARSTVHRALGQLLDAGLIRRGDQLLVEHLPANRRPAVYDLDLPVIRGTRHPVQGSDDETPAGVRQGSDRGPTGVRSGADQGSDSSDTNQELNLRKNRAGARRVLAALDVEVGRTVARCSRCEQLTTPALDDHGHPVGTAPHSDRTGRLCPGIDLPPTIVAAPPGDPRAGAARARATLKETSSQ